MEIKIKYSVKKNYLQTFLSELSFFRNLGILHQLSWIFTKNFIIQKLHMFSDSILKWALDYLKRLIHN